MKLLDLDWYSQPPIDFEHKQYLLYAYMSKVDQKYLEQKVSPHLLHLERMKDEMDYFNPKLEGEDNIELAKIVEIVDYASPVIDAKIRQGYLLFEKYPRQVLY